VTGPAETGSEAGAPGLRGRSAAALRAWRSAIGNRWAFAALATLLYWLDAHALRPLVTIRLDELGASDAQIALTVTAFSGFSLMLAIPGGRLIDRIGLRRVLVASAVGMAASGVGYALATTPAQILGIQAINGVVELGVWLALQTLVSHAGAGESLTRQLALFSLAWGIGVAVGPAIGGAVYGAAGFHVLGLVYAGGALLTLASSLLSPYRGREVSAQEAHTKTSGLMDAMRAIVSRPAVRGVLLASFVALYVQSIRLSFYPLFLERQGVSLSQIGFVLSLMGVASIAVRLPLPALLRWLGAGRVLVLSMWIAVAGIGVTPWLGSVWALAIAAAGIGIGYGVNPAVTVELIARDTQPDERGLAMGLRVASNRLAQMVQPAVFGGISSALSMAAAFPLSGALLAALTMWTARASESMSTIRRRGLEAAEPARAAKQA
jgi:MFS family permease